MHGRHHDDCCVTIVSASYGCLCGNVKDHPDASDNDWRARLNGVNCDCGNESANRVDRYGKMYASASDQREHANGHVPNMAVRKARTHEGPNNIRGDGDGGPPWQTYQRGSRRVQGS